MFRKQIPAVVLDVAMLLYGQLDQSSMINMESAPK